MLLEEIRNISVIGAGTMGHGIALAYALGGYQVILCDVNDEALDNGRNNIRTALETFAEADLISDDMVDRTLSRIITATDLEKAQADMPSSE